jgi:hypothetical protein
MKGQLQLQLQPQLERGERERGQAGRQILG